MPSVAELLDLVAVQGPWLLFLMALLETSFVWGFFIPAGVALSLASAVAFDEGGNLPLIALSAGTGGAIGDTIGYWVGRWGHDRWARGHGRVAVLVIAARARTEANTNLSRTQRGTQFRQSHPTRHSVSSISRGPSDGHQSAIIPRARDSRRSS